MNAIRNFLARFLNFFFFKKRDKKKNLKFFICFLFVFKRFSPNVLKDMIAFFVPNSCASAHSPLNQPAAPCAKGYHLVRTRPQLDLPKVSSSARFSVDCTGQTEAIRFLKSRCARKKAQLPFCFLGRSPDILHGHGFPQVKKESVLCSDQKIPSGHGSTGCRRLFRM